MSTHELIIERLVDGDWSVCRMSELNKGDTFRMWDRLGWGINRLRSPSNWGGNDVLLDGGNQIAQSEPRLTSGCGGTLWGIVAKGENNND